MQCFISISSWWVILQHFRHIDCVHTLGCQISGQGTGTPSDLQYVGRSSTQRSSNSDGK